MSNSTDIQGTAAAYPYFTPPQPWIQYGETETFSESFIGPVSFKLRNLKVAGTAGEPKPPQMMAPQQSPYIIRPDEAFSLSVDLEFNDSDLTKLLLCLGTKLQAEFCLEGCGGKASEVDLTAISTTKKDEHRYTLTYTGTPMSAGLTSGFYAIAVVGKVGPSSHECANHVLGCGYLARVFLLVS